VRRPALRPDPRRHDLLRRVRGVVAAAGVGTAGPDPAGGRGVIDTGVRHLFGAAEAERLFGIPAATIRSWARRKRIYPYGLDERGRPLLDRDDLLALRDQSRKRRDAA